MRIVIDLQGAQTAGSRNRGTGRYSMSLAKSMLRHGQAHEFHVVLNGAFMDAVDPIRQELGEFLPQDRFHIWPAIGPTAHINAENDARRISSEICREAFISNLEPDFIHISSHFEGLFDDFVSSIGRLDNSCPVAVTFYDLIPLIGRELYLHNPDVERWYEDRLSHVRRSDLLLAISESSAQESIRYLNFPKTQVVNIGTDADPQFEPSPVDNKNSSATHAQYRINRPFVMYTGGIDYRKNVEGLVRAYSQLPGRVRKGHQLVIVCAVQPEQKDRLELLAKNCGLAKHDLILTGFVAEDELIALYKTCKLFVFPSWHEGFGLPPLEAMRCGAAVIGGNRSSLPEVIGLEAALFDPQSDEDIRDRMNRGLTDEEFRARLITHGREHNRIFSWDKTGKAALAAIELSKISLSAPITITRPITLKRLAFVSPIPPAPSGIADYSAELIPELARHYDIHLIVKDAESAEAIKDPFIRANLTVRTIDWFKNNFDQFERVLYQMGNSDHHNHMLAALQDFPGVVVLHDFFLSGMISFEQYHYKIENIWLESLYRSHGYAALAYQADSGDLTATIMRYPCNRDVVTNSLGIIVHSQHSKDLARQWLGEMEPERWHLIPLLRESVLRVDREGARERLGFGSDDFIVSSFGYVNPTKQSRRILEAWLQSPLAQQSGAKLVFVGGNHPGDYGKDMLSRIQEAGVEDSVQITGWTDQVRFRDFLAASNVAVQLRTLTRGETSATVLDAMNYGLATIVNAHGSMEYLPKNAVLMLPDDYDDEQLSEALVALATEKTLREELAARAKAHIEAEHSPRICGNAYAQAIESIYLRSQSTQNAVLKQLGQLQPSSWTAEDLAQVALGVEIATGKLQPTTYLDVTQNLVADRTRYQSDDFEAFAKKLVSSELPRRIEPVYLDSALGKWRYARQATFNAIGLPVATLGDDAVSFAPSSDLIRLKQESAGSTGAAEVRPNCPTVVQTWLLQRLTEPSDRGSAHHPIAPTLAKLGFSLRPAN